jgi:hypothetical protein
LALSPEQAAVADYIRKYLGDPVLCVELGDENIEAAIGDAEMWILVHMAPVHQQSFQMVSGQSEYQVLPDVDTVVDVAFPKAALDDLCDQSSEDFYGPVPWAMGSGHGLNHYPQSGITQVQQMAESATRVFSSDPTWIWNRPTRRLILRPANTSGAAIYWYTTKSLSYTDLTVQHDWLLRRYAAAAAKMILGNIRSKYDDYPAAGGRVSMNGSELVAQAQEELIMLDEKIKALAVPMPFLTG